MFVRVADWLYYNFAASYDVSATQRKNCYNLEKPEKKI